MNNEYITVLEFAKMLKIGRSKAYKLVKNPSFPAIRIDKNIRINLFELNKWLNNLSNQDIIFSELESGEEEV